jgi:hypothetical protein
LNIPSRPYSVTQLSPSASLAQVLKIHWREYLVMVGSMKYPVSESFSDSSSAVLNMLASFRPVTFYVTWSIARIQN